MTHHHGTEHPANRADTSGGQVAGQVATQRLLTITKAGKAAGVHRGKIRRSLDEGRFPHAHQDERETWHIPVEDLLAAGYTITLDDIDAPDADSVIDLRSPGSAPTIASPGSESPERALVVLEGWRTSLHDLAGQLADAREAKGVAETKLGVVRERLDEVRAERDALRAQLQAAPRRRRWSRRRGQSQPAAAAGGVDSAS
jgi:hypothetical protein